MLCSAAYAVMRCLCVCVHLCVRPSHSSILSKRVTGRQTILVFHTKRRGNIPTGTPPLPNGDVECSWGRHKSRFWTNSWPSIDDCCWKCDQQLRRTTVQCIAQTATHQCALFITVCSIDEYPEENGTEQNLIVRSGKSEGRSNYNNKRLHSRYRTAEANYRLATKSRIVFSLV